MYCRWLSAFSRNRLFAFLNSRNEQGVDPHLDHDDDLDVNTGNVSQSTRLHHKNREMSKVNDELISKKQQYVERIQKVKQGEARFLQKQKDTIEYLRKFKAFILEVDRKRKQAENKQSAEREQAEKYVSAVAVCACCLSPYFANACRSQKAELEKRQQVLAKAKADRDEAKRQFGAFARLRCRPACASIVPLC